MAPAGMPGVIIPRKTVNELRKLAEETQDEIDIRLSDTKIRFDVGSVLLTSKLIDGTFPEYDRVIPRGNDKMLRVARRISPRRSAASRRSRPERSRPVKLSLGRNHLLLRRQLPSRARRRRSWRAIAVSYEARRSRSASRRAT